MSDLINIKCPEGQTHPASLRLCLEEGCLSRAQQLTAMPPSPSRFTLAGSSSRSWGESLEADRFRLYKVSQESYTITFQIAL